MQDVLLVNPPMMETTRWGKKFTEAQWAPPLGIASLASIAVAYGYTARCADLYYADESELTRLLENEEYRVIGISCFSDQRHSAFTFATKVAQMQPQALVVLGGPHPTFMYEQVLRTQGDVDVVVIGEGDLTLVALLEALRLGVSFEGVPGITYRDNGAVVCTQPRPLIDQLDELPPPMYDDFLQTRYAPCTWLSNTKYAHLVNAPFANILGSRGCAYSCNFCSTPRAWGGHWRCHSPRRIAQELERLYVKYGYKHFSMADDIFTINRRWTLNVCEEITRLGLPLIWSCVTRADLVDSELMTAMMSAGCVLISFGVESGSQIVRDKMNKRLKRESILQAFQLARDVGMLTDMLLMIGNPGETQQTIDETIQLIDVIQPDMVSADICTILPGTAFHDAALTDGYLTEEYWLQEQPAPYYTQEHDVETLVTWLAEITQVKGWAIEHINQCADST